MTNIEHFKAITEQMAQIYEKKNHDYGDSFTQSLNKFGIVAAIVRMEDKRNRLESLIDKKQMVNDESIIDTLTDLANYSIMTAAWVYEKPYKELLDAFISMYDAFCNDVEDVFEGGVERANVIFQESFEVLENTLKKELPKYIVSGSLIGIAYTSIALRIKAEKEAWC